jgi:N-acetylneuraminic acid mutarotase
VHYGKLLIMSTIVAALVVLSGIECQSSLFATTAVQEDDQRPFWTKGEPMPTPRAEVAAAISRDNIYVIGGFDESDQVTDVAEVYNVYNNSWTEAAPLPQPLHHTAAASYDNKIFVIGGYTSAVEDRPWSATNKLFIYDPAENDWQEGEPMPTARGASTAEFINGTLYVIGGVDSSHNVVSTNQAYDPETDTWTERQPMPTARHHLASAVVDGKLYAIGGRIISNDVPIPVNEALSNLNDNEAYDPERDTWTILSPMPTKRSGLAAAAFDSEIFVLGGQSINGTFNSNERYDIQNNTWTIASPMPTSRLDPEALTLENEIYIFGGKADFDKKMVGATEIFHIPN